MIQGLQYTDRFKRDFKRLDAETQGKVLPALEKLLQDPVPRALRHHTLSGYKPTIHVVDVCTNKSYQVTFNLVGGIAVLLRVASHRQIDRSPA